MTLVRLSVGREGWHWQVMLKATQPEPTQPGATKLETPRDVCAANGGWRETFAFHGVQRLRCRYPGR
jgi:hypothetical protein